MSALTQSLAYHAVAFLFQQVLERPLAEARFSQTRLPVVLTCGAVRRPCGGFHLALEYCQDPGHGGATTRLSGKPNPAFWFLGRGSAPRPSDGTLPRKRACAPARPHPYLHKVTGQVR